MAANKPKAILISNPKRESVSLRKLAGVLPRLSDFSALDISALHSIDDLVSTHSIDIDNTAIFIEVDWFLEKDLETKLNLDRANIIAVSFESTESAYSNVPETWKKCISYLALCSIANRDLPKALSVAIAPSGTPGILAITEKNSEILYEKVQRLSEIGHRIDQVVQSIEIKYPEMAAQTFNLRTLCYSTLQLALMESMAASKIVGVVDFQITASAERIAFSTRFSAREEIFALWRADVTTQVKPIWRSLNSTADLLVFTQLIDRKEIEIKALVGREADAHSPQTHSVLFRSIQDFVSDAAADGAKQVAALKVFDTKLPESATALKSLEDESGEHSKRSGMGVGDESLKLKIKADMLEDEKNTLQELVKKKTSLVSGLHKDINKIQKEAATAHNEAQKEALKLRMECEQVRNDNASLKKDLSRAKRKLAEIEEKDKQANVDSGGVKRDFEKELKASEIAKRAAEIKLEELVKKRLLQEEMLEEARKSHREAMAEAKDLKGKVLVLEKAIEAAKSVGGSGKSDGDSRRDSGAGDKLKEAQKQSLDSRQAAENFEKEARRLEIKLANAEASLKTTQAKLDKQLLSSEKVLEEVKKQKMDALKKVDDLTAAIKTKLEEANARERELKRKIDELTAQSGGNKKEKDKDKAA